MALKSGSSVHRDAQGNIWRTSWTTWKPDYPNRVPSKAAGRVGTRRAWKRAHPPGWLFRLFQRSA